MGLAIPSALLLLMLNENNAENTVSVFMKSVNTPSYGDNINITLSKLTVRPRQK